MIKLNVSAANIAVEEKETLTEGRVGLLCQFRFTDEWAGLAKTAVFDGADSRDVILKSDTVAIPAECLSTEGYSLSVGVYGKNAAGDIVIPTVYATVGKIQRSAYPSGNEPAAPTPDVVAQIQQAAANAEAMARSVRDDADLGRFAGPAGEAGGWYTPEIKQPIKGAMVVNFTPSKEGMPAAPGKNIILPQGETGETGGYYTPAVTQPDENTLRVAFTPSKEDMPAVADTDIALPAGGGGGGSGEDGGYYAPSVDDEGNLTWTASKESMPAVDGANIKGQKGDNGGYYTPAVTQTAENTMQVAFTPSETSMPAIPGTEITLPEGTAGEPGSDGKSAYQYAQEGGYTGTEAEFAAKLAQEKFANPNALTFTGAVTGSYDGSEAVTVEIPSGGGGSGDGGIAETLIADFTTAEDVTQIDIPISDDLLSFLNKSREIIYEMKFLLPSSDEGTALGKLQFGHKKSWGTVDTYIYDAQCLPTNSSAYASESYLVGRALFSRLTRQCHTIYAFMVKNQNTRATAARAGHDQIFMSGDTFCAIGSIPIGAGSRIRIYARG